MYLVTGNGWPFGATTGYTRWTPWNCGSVIGVLIDVDERWVHFWLDGKYQQHLPLIGQGPRYYPVCCCYDEGSAIGIRAARSKYSVPEGIVLNQKLKDNYN